MARKVAAFALFFLISSAVFAQDAPQSAAPAQAPPGATSTQGGEVQNFQKIENSWSNAINMRDQYGLELVLSPLFVDVSASGDISTRNQQLVQVISGEDKTVHIDQRVITVRMMGDIAIANGTYVLHHRAGSAEVDEKGVFTHVFERSRGGWVCINSQRTLLREESPNAKPKKKQSEAELPFHIPLFSKSDKSNQ